jgi:hypothetical protein
MDRRSVLVGSIAAVVDATIPGTADATDILSDLVAFGDGNVFECSYPSMVKQPDDWRLWPDFPRNAVNRAVERLLEKNPDAKVVRTTSFCMDETSPRFPDRDPARPSSYRPFYLVRQVKLDRSGSALTAADC